MMVTHHPKAATPPTDKSHPEGIYIGSHIEGRIASGGRDTWEHWQIVTLSPNHTVLKWELHENLRIFMRVLRIFQRDIVHWVREVRRHQDQCVPGISLQNAYKTYISLFYYALDATEVEDFRKRCYTGSLPSLTALALQKQQQVHFYEMVVTQGG